MSAIGDQRIHGGISSSGSAFFLGFGVVVEGVDSPLSDAGAGFLVVVELARLVVPVRLLGRLLLVLGDVLLRLVLALVGLGAQTRTGGVVVGEAHRADHVVVRGDAVGQRKVSTVEIIRTGLNLLTPGISSTRCQCGIPA